MAIVREQQTVNLESGQQLRVNITLVKGKAGDTYLVVAIISVKAGRSRTVGICFRDASTGRLNIEDAGYVADQFKDGEYRL